MKKWNYYNDSDPKVCAWAKELIRAGLVPDGEVDCRPIQEVKPDDLKNFIQCHFFCGILGWSLALRLAGWPDDRPVWSGSCPCQPFSAAGKGKGVDDERHLWPVFRELICACKPAIAFGEQVASKAGREWLAGVFADLEGMDYQRAGADLCAACVGAPHIRQRLFWVAYAGGKSSEWNAGRFSAAQAGVGGARQLDGHMPERLEHGGAACGMAHTQPLRAGAGTGQERASKVGGDRLAIDGDLSGMGDTLDPRSQGHTGHGDDSHEPGRIDADQARPVAATGSGSWTRFDVIPCGDGKARRIEPGLAPLVNGIPARVVRLRGYGNAIVPQVAATFIEEVMACIAESEAA